MRVLLEQDKIVFIKNLSNRRIKSKDEIDTINKKSIFINIQSWLVGENAGDNSFNNKLY
jgi:hypothetical protein